MLFRNEFGQEIGGELLVEEGGVLPDDLVNLPTQRPHLMSADAIPCDQNIRALGRTQRQDIDGRNGEVVGEPVPVDTHTAQLVTFYPEIEKDVGTGVDDPPQLFLALLDSDGRTGL